MTNGDYESFTKLQVLHLHVLTRHYQTPIERHLAVAIARRATAGSNGLTGTVDIITPTVPLVALIRGWLGFPAGIGNMDVHCGLLMLQRSGFLTISEGRPTTLTIAPCVLEVDALDTTPVWGFEELREQAA